jgi:phospholipid/cholesterol/gamma-HCH transport system substrate-binding protein
MKITGTAVKLGASAAVLMLFTAAIVVVFGQMRFDRTIGYAAVFSDASGLRAGQFVRASGVEAGRVSRVEPNNGGGVRVSFAVDRDLPLFTGTTATIRYLNLIGDRYLELQRGPDNQLLSPGATIPIEHTQPALDLDALVGSFRPLFRSLNPEKVNTIAGSLINVFQGQGGTINDILDQTAELTSHIADSDQAIGQVIKNLNTVLETTVKHQKEFDRTVDNFEGLITGLNERADPLADAVAHISDASGTVADLLADDRSLLHDTVGQLQTLQQPIVDKQNELDGILTKWPGALRLIGRSGGIYGDFFNFYLCDITLVVNGLQPGGPVRTVKVESQPSGRCTPK